MKCAHQPRARVSRPGLTATPEGRQESTKRRERRHLPIWRRCPAGHVERQHHLRIVSSRSTIGQELRGHGQQQCHDAC